MDVTNLAGDGNPRTRMVEMQELVNHRVINPDNFLHRSLV